MRAWFVPAEIFALGVLLTLAPHAGAGIDLNIAGVEMGMSRTAVRGKLDGPLAIRRVGRTTLWTYPDTLQVYLRRSGTPRAPRVVGVRTRSPKDRVRDLGNVGVGSSSRALRRRRLECFSAYLGTPLMTTVRGRYCQYPTFLQDDSMTRREKDPRLPALIFRIKRGRVAQITLQQQSTRRPTR